MKLVALLISHVFVAVAGFAGGIYVLPILTAPPGPTSDQMQAAAQAAVYTGELRRDLQGSDPLHWGEGTVHVGRETIALDGRLAPGPDYKLYLSPEFVETEVEFLRLMPSMVRVGDVNTFENFAVAVPAWIDLDRFNTVVVWCETFQQFISAARYR